MCHSSRFLHFEGETPLTTAGGTPALLFLGRFLWRRFLGGWLFRRSFGGFRFSLRHLDWLRRFLWLRLFLRKRGCSKLLPVESNLRNAHRSKVLPVPAQLLVLLLAL